MRRACPRPGSYAAPGRRTGDVLLLEEVFEDRAPGIGPVEVEAVAGALHERRSVPQTRHAAIAELRLRQLAVRAADDERRAPGSHATPPSSRDSPMSVGRLDRAVDVEPGPPPVRSLVEELPARPAGKAGVLQKARAAAAVRNGTGNLRSQSRSRSHALRVGGRLGPRRRPAPARAPGAGPRRGTRSVRPSTGRRGPREPAAAARWQPSRRLRTHRARSAPVCARSPRDHAGRPASTLHDRRSHAAVAAHSVASPQRPWRRSAAAPSPP